MRPRALRGGGRRGGAPAGGAPRAMTCHRAGVWRKLVSSPIGAIDEMRFVSRSPGTLSAICQRAKRRHRRSARLVCGTGPRRQAAHVSQSSRVVRRIGGAGCRARPQRASEAKRRGRSRSRAAQKGSAHFCTTHARRCGGAAGAAVGETSPSSGVPTLGPRLYATNIWRWTNWIDTHARQPWCNPELMP